MDCLLAMLCLGFAIVDILERKKIPCLGNEREFILNKKVILIKAIQHKTFIFIAAQTESLWVKNKLGTQGTF